MSRILIVLLLCCAMSAPAYAEELPTTDTQAFADQYGLDALQLQGAVNSTKLPAEQYLEAIGVIPVAVAIAAPAPIVQSRSGRSAYVRVTHYYLSGLTANNGTTYNGSTACSYNFAFGTTFTFNNGLHFVCNDRGRLYYNPATEDGWLDLWGVAGLDGHATVAVGP